MNKRGLGGVGGVLLVAVVGGCHWVFPHLPQESAAQDSRPADRKRIGDGPVDGRAESTDLDARGGRVDLVAANDGRGDFLASTDSIAVKEAGAKEAGVAKEAGIPPVGCGNGLLGAGETCDDGNQLAGDLCSPDCQTIDFACKVDHTTMGQSGGMLADTADLVPLCDGWVLVGDRQTKSVKLRKPVMSLVQRSYTLSASPGRMAMDPAGKILWVALAGVPKIARVVLVTSKVDEIALTGVPFSLALRANGDLFVSLGAGLTAPVVVVEAGKLAAKQAGTTFPLLAFDSSREHLIAAQAGFSPSSVARFLYDPAQIKLTPTGTQGSCTNGTALALSPDAQHLALVCAGGPYVVTDRSPDDLAIIQGSFQVGAYPEDAAFSPDGKELVATNRDDLRLFSVASYAQTSAYAVPNNTTGIVRRVGFSTGGKVIFALRSGTSSGWLAWYAVH